MQFNFELLNNISFALSKYFINESYLFSYGEDYRSANELTEDDINFEASVFAVPFLYYYLEKNKKTLEKLDLVNAVALIVNYFEDYLMNRDRWLNQKKWEKDILDYFQESEMERIKWDKRLSDSYQLTKGFVEIDDKVFEIITLNQLKHKGDKHYILAKDKLTSLKDIDRTLLTTIKQRPDLAHFLNWRTFEKLIREILESSGYKVELMQGSKDGGIDLIAFKNSELSGTDKFIIQAKHWNSKVGIEPVRSLAFLHNHHKATKSILLTTSSFTRGAWKLANAYQHQISLSGFSEFVKILK